MLIERYAIAEIQSSFDDLSEKNYDRVKVSTSTWQSFQRAPIIIFKYSKPLLNRLCIDKSFTFSVSFFSFE